MKKLTILLLFFVVFLMWCKNSSWQELTFIQASDIFFETTKKTAQKYDILGFNAIWLSFDIFWDNKDFKLHSKIETSGFVDYTIHNLQSDTNILVNFLDKYENKESVLSGHISNIVVDNNLYWKLNDFYIDIWTWNYQSELLRLITQNLQNKRIKLLKDWEINNEIKDLIFIKDLISTLQTPQDLFELIQEATYDGNLAYKIRLNPTIVDQINKNTDIQINKFNWLLVIYSSSNIELKLENLETQNTKITWTISNKKVKLQFKPINIDENTKSQTTQLLLEQNKKSIAVQFSSLLYLKEMIWLKLQIYPKLTQSGSKTQINWLLTISPLIIYWSDLEKNIEIDINGQYDLQHTTPFIINQPPSYILGDQILWDTFSLQTLLSD